MLVTYRNWKHLIAPLTLLIGLFMMSVAANAQTDAQKNASELNKEIFKIIKKNSLFTDRLDWKAIQTKSEKLLFTDNDATNTKLIFDFYQQNLRAVGDKHSFFISSNQMNEISKTPVAEIPNGAYLGDGIGWVKGSKADDF